MPSCTVHQLTFPMKYVILLCTEYLGTARLNILVNVRYS